MIILELFITFFKVGLFTFGGGYAMLPMIQEEVISHGWMELEDLVDFVAVSESTPGPFAVNIATFVGFRTGNVIGALAATLGVVLPSFIIILIVARFVTKFKDSFVVKGCLSGLKPAVIGLIGSAILTMVVSTVGPLITGWSTFTSPAFYITLVIFVLAALMIFWRKLNPIFVILISAALGIAGGYIFSL